MTIRLIPEQPDAPHRLGRHVHHDPRSLAYAHGVLPSSAIKSVRWTRRVGIFDQGNLGSCTGNAAAGLVGTDSAGRQGATSVTITADQAAKTKGVFKAGTYAVDEAFAVLCYELNTRLDTYSGTYKPTDTGSDGLAGAKTLQALGLADTYTHGFSIDALGSALQAGPVMIGVQWMNSMFDTDADGRIVVTRTSGVAGGHELCMDEIDVENGRYWVSNSWAESWGVGGRGYFTKADMVWLLSQQGDVTVPHMLGAPQPTPAPTPVPTPPPVPSPSVDPDALAAYQALKHWATLNGVA